MHGPGGILMAVKKPLSVFDCLCHNLRKTSRLLTQYYDEALKESGLRITQFTLMAAVREMGEATYVPLAEFLGMDRTTLSRNVDLLVRDGLVEVHAGLLDKRQSVVRLTAKGSEALELAWPLWESAQRKATKQIKKGELPAMMGNLSKLSELG